MAAGLQLGPLGGPSSRRPGTPPSRPAGRTTRRRSRRPESTPKCSPNKSVGDIAAYQQQIIERLDRKPAIIGHSFGGLLVQILAGRGLSAATVAIDPAPSRGVLPLPIAALKSSSAVLSNPANRHRSVALTFEQFRYGFGNAVSEEEAKELYETFHVAGSGVPVFQAASANFNPALRPARRTTRPPTAARCWSSPASSTTRCRTPSRRRRTSGRRRTRSVTEFQEIEGRGHSLTIDAGWREVAQVSLDFISRFVK